MRNRGDFVNVDYKKFLPGNLDEVRRRKGLGSVEQVLSPDKTRLWVRLQ